VVSRVSGPGVADRVLVQVVPVESGREIGWGSSRVEALGGRLEEVREAVMSGARAVADSLPGLPAAEGWRLGEVSGSFGICLTAEGGVVLMAKASAAVTFEVTVTFQRQ
jgi:Trypsin-co-occurring domain 1